VTDLEIRSSDGTRLVVRRVGAGDPVVLVHGSGGGLHSWAGVAALLEEDFEVWMPARRGYGPSDVPPGPKSFEAEIADVLAVIEAAGRPVHLVGASYGALLALHTAVRAAGPATAVRTSGPATAVRAAGPATAVRTSGPVRSLAIFEPPLFATGEAIGPLLERYRSAFEREDAAGMFAVLNEVTRVPAEIVAAFAAAGERKPDPVEERRSAVGWLHDLEALAGDRPDPGRWAALTVPTLLMSGGSSSPGFRSSGLGSSGLAAAKPGSGGTEAGTAAAGPRFEGRRCSYRKMP
jgi:pimeloyl-ACP methyl ester carboxylesterase